MTSDTHAAGLGAVAVDAVELLDGQLEGAELRRRVGIELAAQIDDRLHRALAVG